jgi:hypothetical protein
MTPHSVALRVEAPSRQRERGGGSTVIGKRVRVSEHHTIAERRGRVGEVVGYYGGDDYVAVEVRLFDGEHRLFWPGDLEEISPPSASA